MSDTPDFSKMTKLAPGFYADDAGAIHVDFDGLCADLGFTPSRESYEALMRAAKELLPGATIEERRRTTDA